MASIATSDRLIHGSPSIIEAAIRAIVKTQVALKQNFDRAAAVGRKRFPPAEAELIAELVRGDLPFYDATISRSFV
jgi:hypothetical protein